MRRIVIVGAGGRDLHDCNVVFRDDPDTMVVTFHRLADPGIADLTCPPALAGLPYPLVIPTAEPARPRSAADLTFMARLGPERP